MIQFQLEMKYDMQSHLQDILDQAKKVHLGIESLQIF